MSGSKNKERAGVVAGTVLAIALTAVLCGIYALLVKNGKDTQEHSDLIISTAIAVSVLTSSLITSVGRGSRRIYGLVLGLIYAAILTAVPLLAYPSEVDWFKIIRIFAVAAVSGLIGGSINLGKSNKNLRKSRK